MKKIAHILSFMLAICLFCSPAAQSSTVHESAREIPVAYDVDVVVVGGTSGGVAAAVEAARQGASVFLARAFRPIVCAKRDPVHLRGRQAVGRRAQRQPSSFAAHRRQMAQCVEPECSI
ncbi:MAG: FAD-dependent oxidoreductase [Planctomycetota bacterium]